MAFRYVGEKGGVEETLSGSAGIPFSAIATGQVRGRTAWAAARNLARMAHGAAECTQIIRQFRPDALLMTGGYVAAPVAWAAWRARPRVPLLIYLPDITPGQAIRFTSRLADRVAVSFPEVAGHFPGKAVCTGYPVRPELIAAQKTVARAELQLELDLPVLLVFGGSRGARSINSAVVAALPKLLSRCQIVHVSGELDWPSVQQTTDRIVHGLPSALRRRYRLHPYLHDAMVQALAAADLAVARAGASVLGEFPARGLPGILVPFPYAGQHQEANAAYLADRGAAVIVHDSDLSARLAPTILELLDAPGELQGMAEAASELARPDAAHDIALELLRLARG